MITRDIKDRYINPYTDFGFGNPLLLWEIQAIG